MRTKTLLWSFRKTYYIAFNLDNEFTTYVTHLFFEQSKVFNCPKSPSSLSKNFRLLAERSKPTRKRSHFSYKNSSSKISIGKLSSWRPENFKENVRFSPSILIPPVRFSTNLRILSASLSLDFSDFSFRLLCMVAKSKFGRTVFFLGGITAQLL